VTLRNATSGVTATFDYGDLCVAFRNVSGDGKRLSGEAFRVCRKTEDQVSHVATF
jgi:hypothetical protein